MAVRMDGLTEQGEEKGEGELLGEERRERRV